MKRFIITVAVAVAAVIPAAALSATTTDARGGFGEWPVSHTR